MSRHSTKAARQTGAHAHALILNMYHPCLRNLSIYLHNGLEQLDFHLSPFLFFSVLIDYFDELFIS